MRRPYDLRHSGITWRLNSGVPATEIAAWAGHSVREDGLHARVLSHDDHSYEEGKSYEKGK